MPRYQGGVRHVDLGPAIYDFSNRLEDFHRDESTMMGPYLSAVRRYVDIAMVEGFIFYFFGFDERVFVERKESRESQE